MGRCDTCRFWNVTHHPQGECRRYAPQPKIQAGVDAPIGLWLWAHWPLTLADDGCGEHAPPAVAQQLEPTGGLVK